MTLHLVRHGRPLIDPSRPAAEWELDPASYDDVWALRESGVFPSRASWFSSPEPKAQQTAQLLTDGQVGIVEELREHERGPGWIDDFESAVRRAFVGPDDAAVEGWEPLTVCRDRVVELTGSAPDLAAWSALRMPDVITLSI